MFEEANCVVKPTLNVLDEEAGFRGQEYTRTKMSLLWGSHGAMAVTAG